jgi:hypothetical protein
MRRRIVLTLCLLGAANVTALAAAAADKQLLWGDTHLHTNYSFDAITVGNKTGDPAAAYRYARGLPVVHPYHRARVQIKTPLDFLVVSDHAEFMGVIKHTYEHGVPTEGMGVLESLQAWLTGVVIKVGLDRPWGPGLFSSRLPLPEDPPAAAQRVADEGLKVGGIPPLPPTTSPASLPPSSAGSGAQHRVVPTCTALS